MFNMEIQLIAIVVALACSIPGVFLILRKMSMMTDAITHTILLGIVMAFLITNDLNSPLLIIGATLMGVFTVFLTEVIHGTGLVAEDSSIGIVFPFLFSIAIIMISKYAGAVHLDTDSVFLGQLEFAIFNRFKLFGKDLGPKSLFVMGSILLVNIVYVGLFFKELKLATFDKGLALALGFSPTIIHYSLMGIVSITAVGAFEAVGSIVVIAFMVGPPVTAYLMTDDLKRMIFLSGGVGVLNGILGYQFAMIFDVSIGGSMALMTGVVFLLVFIFAKERGLISTIRRRKSQEKEFAEKSLLFHLYNHEDQEDSYIENGVKTIMNHLKWDKTYIDTIVKDLKDKKMVYIEKEVIKLTDLGREYTIRSYEEIVNSF